MKYKGIIFDLDGVLVYTDKYHYLAWKQIADRLGIYFDEEINNRLRGVSRMASLEIILERSTQKFSDEQKEELAEEKNEIYRQYLGGLTQRELGEGVLQTLEKFKTMGLKLAVGSSSRNTELILKKTGIYEYFDVISDGNNISKPKPDPEVFIKAADMLGLLCGQCLVVEDAVSGVLAATAANMDCAAIGDAAKHKMATYNIETFDQLVDIFLENNTGRKELI